MDALSLIQRLPFTPAIFNSDTIAKFGRRIRIPDTTFKSPAFLSSRKGVNGEPIPQAVAHRGFKSIYAENTLEAFQHAVDVGAHALETDVHLSKDGIVVLSHDKDLNRCFSRREQIKDCNWSQLKTVQATDPRRGNLACFGDLLKMFQKDDFRDKWLMIDIKTDDNAEEMMKRLSATFDAVEAGHGDSWKDKVVLGYWTAEYIPLCEQYLPGFSIMNVGFSPTYSQQFLDINYSGFNFLQAALIFPHGQSFFDKIDRSQRKVFAWTVNDEKNMDWCIRRQLDGVVTDKIPEFLSMCESQSEGRAYRWQLKLLLGFAYFNIWVYLFGLVFRQRYGTCISHEPKKSK